MVLLDRVVAKEVLALKRGEGGPPIHVSADDGDAYVMTLLEHGIDQGLPARRTVRAALWRLFGRASGKAVGCLFDVPAVVATFLDDVDLFKKLLPKVGGVERAVSIEGYTPRIAESIRLDLLRALLIHEGIVVGDCVSFVPFSAVHIDAQDGAKKICREVLAVATVVNFIPVLDVSHLFIIRAAAVAQGDVKIAVGAKGDLPGVVI